MTFKASGFGCAASFFTLGLGLENDSVFGPQILSIQSVRESIPTPMMETAQENMAQGLPRTKQWRDWAFILPMVVV